MDLRSAVKRYMEVAGAFGRPMALVDFQCDKKELEAALSEWDDDYRINCHFELTNARNIVRSSPEEFQVQGRQYNGIVFKESIADVLG